MNMEPSIVVDIPSAEVEEQKKTNVTKPTQWKRYILSIFSNFLKKKPPNLVITEGNIRPTAIPENLWTEYDREKAIERITVNTISARLPGLQLNAGDIEWLNKDLNATPRKKCFSYNKFFSLIGLLIIVIGVIFEIVTVLKKFNLI